jgi:hypothetical protein
MLHSVCYDVYMRTQKWVVGSHMPLKVKTDGAVRYGFRLVSEQWVHEAVSEIWNAVISAANMAVFFVICSNLAFFKYMNGVFKVHNNEIRFFRILFFNGMTHNLN